MDNFEKGEVRGFPQDPDLLRWRSEVPHGWVVDKVDEDGETKVVFRRRLYSGPGEIAQVTGFIKDGLTIGVQSKEEEGQMPAGWDLTVSTKEPQDAHFQIIEEIDRLVR